MEINNITSVNSISILNNLPSEIRSLIIPSDCMNDENITTLDLRRFTQLENIDIGSYTFLFTTTLDIRNLQNLKTITLGNRTLQYVETILDSGSSPDVVITVGENSLSLKTSEYDLILVDFLHLE